MQYIFFLILYVEQVVAIVFTDVFILVYSIDYFGSTSGYSEIHTTWWRHQVKIFFAILAICAGNSPIAGEFPTQRPLTRRFDVFFDLHPNKWLSKQSWGCCRCFVTPSRPLRRHCNDFFYPASLSSMGLNAIMSARGQVHCELNSIFATCRIIWLHRSK